MTDRNELVALALAELRDVVHCRCIDAYKDRGLQDPQCQCDSQDAVDTIADRIEADAATIARLEREKRLAQAIIDVWEAEFNKSQARVKELEAAKWAEKHTSTMNDIVQMGMARDEAVAAKDAAEAKLARAVEGLRRIDEWVGAYPLSAFPEPDMAKVGSVLSGAGLSLDAVSASNMRHVVQGVGTIARATIAEIEGA